MKIKPSVGDKIFNIFNVTLMLIICFLTLYPVWYIIVYSFGRTLVVYHNPRKLNTYDKEVKVSKYILHFDDKVVEIEGEKVPEPYSYEVRKGVCKKIEVLL